MSRSLIIALSLATTTAVPAFAQAPAPQDTTILPPSEIGVLRVGQTASGMLEAGDHAMGDGTWADVWYFQGTAGQRVVIELRSRAFDAYLMLLDAAGNKLADDDDSAGGNDARVTYTLRASERYQIVVNNFGDTQQTGLYTISLR